MDQQKIEQMLMDKIFGTKPSSGHNAWTRWFISMASEKLSARPKNFGKIELGNKTYPDWKSFWKETLSIRSSVKTWPDQPFFEPQYHEPLLKFYFDLTDREDGSVVAHAKIPFYDVMMELHNIIILSGRKYETIKTDNTSHLDKYAEEW